MPVDDQETIMPVEDQETIEGALSFGENGLSDLKIALDRAKQLKKYQYPPDFNRLIAAIRTCISSGSSVMGDLQHKDSNGFPIGNLSLTSCTTLDNNPTDTRVLEFRERDKELTESWRQFLGM